jgi:AcrR family transcriptional regulator
MTVEARRASPMAPDERRAAIVEATLPLLRAHGNAVTTKQIADACGVGEGTVFRAFPDKAAIIDAALATAFDPAPGLEQLGRIDPTLLPLGERLVAAVEVLQDRLRSVIGLMTVLGRTAPQAATRRRVHDDDQLREGQARILRAIEDLIAPDADALRVSPAQAARTVRMLTFAGTHPGVTDETPMSASEIVSILLHGVLNSGVRDREAGSPCC